MHEKNILVRKKKEEENPDNSWIILIIKIGGILKYHIALVYNKLGYKKVCCTLPPFERRF